MEVVVEDKQLSLAIGKKGQNVRLAAKLTGWRIDIKSEEEKRREVEEQFGALGGDEPVAEESATSEATGEEPGEEPAAEASADEVLTGDATTTEEPAADADEAPAEMETEKS